MGKTALVARDFTPAEMASLAGSSDADIEGAALADADAQPASAELLQRGLQARRRRWLEEQQLEVGYALTPADHSGSVPVWEITDAAGHTVAIEASSIRALPADVSPARVLKIEPVGPAARKDSPER